MSDEGALRRTVEQTQAALDELRDRYRQDPDEKLGRALLDARAQASAALEALWDARPDEKPPTQRAL